MKRSVAVGLFTVVALALAGPLAAQDYPPQVFGELAVSDSTVICGAQSITLNGTGWLPGEAVEIVFNPTLATTVADSNGNFSVNVAIPQASLGDHTLTAIQLAGQAGEVSGSASITCVSSAGLAGTGANIATWVAIAVGLLLAGGAALLTGRRRKATADL